MTSGLSNNVQIMSDWLQVTAVLWEEGRRDLDVGNPMLAKVPETFAAMD